MEASYSVNISTSRNSVHCNAANSFQYGAKIYKFKAKNFEKNPYPLCLRNITKGFAVDDMKKMD